MSIKFYFLTLFVIHTALFHSCTFPSKSDLKYRVSQMKGKSDRNTGCLKWKVNQIWNTGYLKWKVNKIWNTGCLKWKVNQIWYTRCLKWKVNQIWNTGCLKVSCPQIPTVPFQPYSDQKWGVNFYIDSKERDAFVIFEKKRNHKWKWTGF